MDQNHDLTHDQPDQAAASAPPPAPRSGPKRRSSEEIAEDALLEAQRKADAAQQKLIKHRDERRAKLLEDLFTQHGVDAIEGDPSERRRISQLRQKLGLAPS